MNKVGTNKTMDDPIGIWSGTTMYSVCIATINIVRCLLCPKILYTNSIFLGDISEGILNV